MNLNLGDIVRLYDTNDIKKVYVVGMDTHEEYMSLCVDCLTHEVVYTFKDSDNLNDMKFVKEEDFNIKEEILKCITNIRLKYPNEEISFSNYHDGTFLEIYRVNKDKEYTHQALVIDCLSEDDVKIIEEIEKSVQKPQRLSMWTVTVISRGRGYNEDHEFMIECDDEQGVKETLKDLKDEGQDMDYVAVFAPNTGLLGSEFNI